MLHIVCFVLDYTSFQYVILGCRSEIILIVLVGNSNLFIKKKTDYTFLGEFEIHLRAARAAIAVAFFVMASFFSDLQFCDTVEGLSSFLFHFYNFLK
jgi:hypothetical protein